MTQQATHKGDDASTNPPGTSRTHHFFGRKGEEGEEGGKSMWDEGEKMKEKNAKERDSGRSSFCSLWYVTRGTVLCCNK